MPASWYVCDKCGFKGVENPEFPATRCPRCHSQELSAQDAPNSYDEEELNPFGLK